MTRPSLPVLSTIVLLCGAPRLASRAELPRVDTSLTIRPDEPLVALQPLGPVGPALVAGIEDELTKTFAVRVKVLPERPLPRSAFYPARNRYRGDRILDWLETETPRDAYRVVAITAKDISVTKDPYPDWGVFGVSQLSHRPAIVSEFRMSRGVSETKLEMRLRTVAAHELGHTLGLEHCPNPGCLMNDAEGHIHSVDVATKLCPTCQKKLGAALRRPESSTLEAALPAAPTPAAGAACEVPKAPEALSGK